MHLDKARATRDQEGTPQDAGREGTLSTARATAVDARKNISTDHGGREEKPLDEPQTSWPRDHEGGPNSGGGREGNISTDHRKGREENLSTEPFNQ